MRTSLFRAALTSCLLGSATFAIGAFATSAVAAEKPAAPAVPIVSKPVGVLLDAAKKLMIANDFVTAKATVTQALAVPNRTPIDDYEIDNFLGNIAIKLNDHPTADTMFETMAESPVIPEADKPATFRIATLLANEAKHFDKAIKYGHAFIALGGPPDDLVLSTMSQSYYFTNDFANAETFANQSIAATAPGKVPNQSAYQVLLGSQIKLKKEAAAIGTLEKMATYYNDPADWGQLIDASSTIKMKPIELLFFYRLRLATRASASGEEYSAMADIPLSIGYPAEAQAILELGLATGKLSNSGKTAAKLADARSRTVKDRAGLASFDAMATKSATGELDVKLAEAYFGYGRYADAEAAARRAIGKDGAKTDLGEANMVLGMALALEGKSADALAAFNSVKGGSAALMKAQHLWSLYAGRKTTTAAATP